MPSILTPAPEKINNKSSEVDYLKLEDMCSQMVHLSASEPLQVLRAVYLKLASSYFPAPKIEKFSCAKKNSNRCKAMARLALDATLTSNPIRRSDGELKTSPKEPA